MRALILNDNIALVAARDGYFLVNRKDIYIGNSIEIYGEHGGIESAFLKSLVKPGDCVIEVGANIGAHTVGLAKAVGPNGRVHAFEPQRVCCALLSAQIALNQLENVHVYNQGVGKTRGQFWVPPINYHEPGNFGGIALSQRQTQAFEPVEAVSLDEIFGDILCALFKIDVEGMEEDVIRGARNLITKRRPLLYVENDRADKSKSLISLLLELGYRIWWHTPMLYNPKNFFCVKQNIYANVTSFNMFCSHETHQSASGLIEIKSPDDPHPLASKSM